jgi:hypothetical protein
MQNRSICVLPEVVDDLDVWSQEMLSHTVWAAPCRSWYKNGRTDGRITALHAGSVIHYRGQIGIHQNIAFVTEELTRVIRITGRHSRRGFQN